MYKFFGIALLSLIFTGLLAIPFINFLYRLKFQSEEKKKDIFGKKTPVFNRLRAKKKGVPVGGGILVISSVVIFSFIFYLMTKFRINWTTATIFYTLLSFALLGFYDDIQKFINVSQNKIWGMKAVHKLAVQLVLATVAGLLLFNKMGLSSIHLPELSRVIGINLLPTSIELGIFYIPFAALTIVLTANSYNITSGVDGLATGLLIIALCALWAVAGASPFSGDIILFIAVLVGALIAFLYFNIYPARFIDGDVGTMAFGATLALIALISDQVIILPIISGVFYLDAFSSLLQWFYRWKWDKKVFRCAPVHHHLEAIGWHETKITMRAWLVGAALALLGLLIGTL